MTYYESPYNIQKSMHKFVFNNDKGKLVSINTLEYASFVINYVATLYILTHMSPSLRDPHTAVLLYADNRTTESWLIKASKVSHVGQALGCIQAALMINNSVGTNVDHITSEENKIADRISHITSEAILLTKMKKKYQDHPKL